MDTYNAIHFRSTVKLFLPDKTLKIHTGNRLAEGGKSLQKLSAT